YGYSVTLGGSQSSKVDGASSSRASDKHFCDCSLESGDSCCRHANLNSDTRQSAIPYTDEEAKQQADLWILNSCTVKGPAEDHFRNAVLTGTRKGKRLVVAGCVPQSRPGVDYLKGVSVIGVQQIDRVVEVVEETLRGNTVRFLDKKWAVAEDGSAKRHRLGGAPLDLPKIRRNPLIEILAVSTGCLNSCTYCKTKHARGVLASYPIEQLLRRAEQAFAEKHRIFVQTWGCTHNTSDSEYMAGLLAHYGYSVTLGGSQSSKVDGASSSRASDKHFCDCSLESGDSCCRHANLNSDTRQSAIPYTDEEAKQQADLWILNSCTVKGPAEDHFRNAVLTGTRKGKRLVVAGCVPQSRPGVDYLKGVSVIGVQQIDRVVEVVEETLRGNTVRFLDKKWAVAEDGSAKRHRLGGAPLDLPKIRRNPLIEILAHARGVLASYPIEQLLRRAEQAFADGVKELWLTSEDLGAYGRDLDRASSDCSCSSLANRFPHYLTLADLLAGLVRLIPAGCMLRLGMTNPPYILEQLQEVADVLNHPRVYSFLHVPVQSGSDAVLERMNREYTVEDFSHVVSFLQERVKAPPLPPFTDPGAVNGCGSLTIATDIICGFPNETETDFDETVRLIERFQFPVLYINQFFARPGTPAASMPRKATTADVKKRTRRLHDLFRTYMPYTGRVGAEVRVLVTEISHDGRFWVGHTKAYEQSVLLSPGVPPSFESSSACEVLSRSRCVRSTLVSVLDLRASFLADSFGADCSLAGFRAIWRILSDKPPHLLYLVYSPTRLNRQTRLYILVEKACGWWGDCLLITTPNVLIWPVDLSYCDIVQSFLMSNRPRRFWNLSDSLNALCPTIKFRECHNPEKATTADVKKRTRRLHDLFRTYMPYTGRVGAEVRVLVTEISHDGRFWVGHTKAYEQVLVPKLPHLMGRIVLVRITECDKFFMRSDLIDPGPFDSLVFTSQFESASSPLLPSLPELTRSVKPQLAQAKQPNTRNPTKTSDPNWVLRFGAILLLVYFALKLCESRGFFNWALSK
ncbi:hypothetical protein AHF37_01447, partial [Paragonimus kellicotti]